MTKIMSSNSFAPSNNNKTKRNFASQLVHDAANLSLKNNPNWFGKSP